MNVSASIFSDWHRLGAGLSVRFALAAGRFDAEWSPRPPTRREWKRVIERYRRARHLFLDRMAAQTGKTVLCMEMEP